MLDCDRCHRWFHGPCVGVATQEVCGCMVCGVGSR
ncbi:unnamed protein product [Laminaria digitata]